MRMSGVLSAIGALVLGAGVGSFVTTLIIEKKVSSQKDTSPATGRQSDLEDTKKMEAFSKSIEDTRKRMEGICAQLNDYLERLKTVATAETSAVSSTSSSQNQQEQLEASVAEAQSSLDSMDLSKGEIPTPPQQSVSSSEQIYESQQQEYPYDSDLSSQLVQNEYVTEQEQQYMDEPEQQDLMKNPPQEEPPQKMQYTMENVFQLVKQLRENSPQYYTYNKSACRFDSVSNKDAPYVSTMDKTTGERIMLPNETTQFRATKLQDKPYICSTKQVVDGSFVIEQFCIVNDALEIIQVGRIIN